MAYKEGFLDTPLVDVWALKLEENLNSLFPNYTSSIDRRFRFLPIISVNTPYRYRTYSVLGNVLRLGKKVLERDWSELKKQLRVLLRIDQDPYCNVEKIVELHNRNSLRPLFAFRISNKKWYKRPVYFAYSTYKKVLCRNYQIALCISGVASNSVTQLKMEQKILSRIFRTRIVIGTSSLSEYVVPKFYRNLSNSKIKEDFSMSYPDRIGFRASTCTPFRVYDLNREEYYRIDVHSVPFTVWSVKRMGLNKEEIVKAATSMAKTVKSLKGEFIIASHNYNFVDSSMLKGWASTYEYVIRYVSLLETTDVEKVEKMNL